VKDRELSLRYGINPHQTPARAFVRSGRLPIEPVAGAPSYVNMLDALNAWQLVRELARSLGLPAAASFKHVSPAGAAVAVPLDDETRRAALVPPELELSPLATAYARARSSDRLASFGDFVALSERCDLATAQLLAVEVSDGIIAPEYEGAALDVLRKKRGGKYAALRVDPSYEPSDLETREVFGVTLEQRRNNALIDETLLAKVVTRARDVPPDARRDLAVALIATKYTQSNSVVLARDGQTLGVGAGQQARVDCVRLACDKADAWWLRRHPRVHALRLAPGARRPDRDNAIDALVRGDLSPVEREELRRVAGAAEPLSVEEKREWLAKLGGVSLASDAFFPFRDSIDRAARTGVTYVAQPGGSQRDAEVIQGANEHRMVMCFTGLRLFHH
jgi:AICAR transformylase/IMP cyclohydrolase PurH